MDSRLRVPLADLWPEIRIPGLPVWHPRYGEFCWMANDGGVVVASPSRGMCGYISDLDWAIDLSRPGASDILARRLATAVGCDTESLRFTLWKYFVLYGDDNRTEWNRLQIPALADLDSTCDDRLDWLQLGQPKVVNLVALGMVCVHVFRQECEG